MTDDLSSRLIALRDQWLQDSTDKHLHIKARSALMRCANDLDALLLVIREEPPQQEDSVSSPAIARE